MHREAGWQAVIVRSHGEKGSSGGIRHAPWTSPEHAVPGSGWPELLAAFRLFLQAPRAWTQLGLTGKQSSAFGNTW